MKEVILLKDVGKHKKGDKVTIPRGMANYWKRMGVSKYYVKPKSKPKKKKKMTNQELLIKVKENLNLDIDNNEQDNYLLSLIDSVKNIASKKTGLDFEIAEMPEGVAYSIVDNVSNKFDDGGYELDVSVFQMYNNEPML